MGIAIAEVPNGDSAYSETRSYFACIVKLPPQMTHATLSKGLLPVLAASTVGMLLA